MAIGGQSASGSVNNATSMSRTYGTEASNRAAIAANSANNAANAAWQQAAAYNAEEAQKQRDWAERMANTTYQRTVKDMIAAGINPILAANMGLSADSVSSGAVASMGNPMSYMANTFADSESASKSHGSSWGESMSGLAYLADAISGLIGAANSANNITIALEGLGELYAPTENSKTGDGKTVKEHREAGDYDKTITEAVKGDISTWIEKPAKFFEDTLRYITFKNSGGTLKYD